MCLTMYDYSVWLPERTAQLLFMLRSRKPKNPGDRREALSPVLDRIRKLAKITRLVAEKRIQQNDDSVSPFCKLFHELKVAHMPACTHFVVQEDAEHSHPRLLRESVRKRLWNEGRKRITYHGQ